MVAPHFVAGLLIDPASKLCVEAAPILRWAVGKSAAELRAYFDAKGWEAKRV